MLQIVAVDALVALEAPVLHGITQYTVFNSFSVYAAIRCNMSLQVMLTLLGFKCANSTTMREVFWQYYQTILQPYSVEQRAGNKPVYRNCDKVLEEVPITPLHVYKRGEN